MQKAKLISSGPVVSRKVSCLVTGGMAVAVLAASVHATGEWPSASGWLWTALAAGLLLGIALLGVAGLADEVWDLGDHLVVSRNGTRARIELAHIFKADASVNTSPARVTLHLVKPSAWGRQVAFRPAGRATALGKDALAGELMQRAQAARGARTAVR